MHTLYGGFFMPKIIAGSILKYILGESKQTNSELTATIHSAKNKEEIEDCLRIIKDDLAAYRIMKNHIDKNKWKEGLLGGAIAGGVIIGIAPAIGAVGTIANAVGRFGGSMFVGVTSSLFFNKITGSKCINREEYRADLIEKLLAETEDKLNTLENPKPLSR